MHPSLRHTEHRPWPLPRSPWKWRQTWHDLAFLHWPVRPEALRTHVPPPLELDLHDGFAWLGLVPFRMSGVTLRGVPAVPWLSRFIEMNLRTYVTLGDRPGVFFLRMDASRLPAVLAARGSLGLPYVWSSMRVREENGAVDYSSRNGAAAFEGQYRPTGAVAPAVPNSREWFLTERYCLYTRHRQRLLRVDIHHAPFPLQPAAVDVRRNTIPQSCGLPPQPDAPVAHFSKRQEVIGWGAMEPVA